MNKKGFTLVELLAVITIIALLLTIILPATNSVLKRSKNTIYDVQIKDILNSTYDYSLKKPNLLPEDGDTTYILLIELKKYGYIENNLKDPKTNEAFGNDLVISITKVENGYKNKDNKALLNGNYLYKIENKTEKAKIKVSNNFYNLNLGDELIEYPGVSAVSNSGGDISRKVIKNITYNNTNVDTIDTKHAGLYYVDYCVVDSQGYSACETVVYSVNDSTPPTLEVPDGVTLTLTTTSYDLNDGVKCEDNSGKCNIEIIENIKFGTAGKYVVTYKATDPSGNTYSEKRVITIQ